MTRREWAAITALLDNDSRADLLDIVRQTSPGVRRLIVANLKRVGDTQPPLGPGHMIWHALALSHHDLIIRAAEQRAREDLIPCEQLRPR